MGRFLIYFLIFCAGSWAQPCILVGIAGGTASGKSTLAQQLKQEFQNQATIVSQDFYYKDQPHLTHEEREKLNFDHPDSLDFKLMQQQLLALKNGRAIEAPVYNFCTHSREIAPQIIQPAQFIIVEGILLFAVPEVRDLFDLRIFVETDDDIRILRRLERDMAERARGFTEVRDQYLQTVKPMHDLFVSPSKQFADLIFPSTMHNPTAVQFIATSLRQMSLKL